MITISGPGASAAGLSGEQHLEAQQRVERDIEKQAGKHGRNRRRTLGMRIGQPRVQRRKPDLGSVAEQQEDERNIE